MKLAVISDIHANLEAFDSVLADIDAAGVDDIICLGDVVGYGPDPEAVVRRVRERGIVSVQGNHDRAVCQPKHRSWFNPIARTSLEMTAGMLSEETRSYLATFEPALVRNGRRFVHGFPPASVSIYLFQVIDSQLRRAFQRIGERICFVGHTHELEVVAYDGETLSREPLAEGSFSLDPDHRYIINVGSVGQPRDGVKGAKYVCFDDAAGTIDVRFIPYDAETTADKIIRAGLPRIHADRLL